MAGRIKRIKMFGYFGGHCEFSENEKCFRRCSKLFIRVSLLFISATLFTMIFSRRHPPSQVFEKEKSTDHNLLYAKRGKIVLLYTNQRSGSSFVGEFFNKNPEAFYLFEPLFGFGLFCDLSYDERLQTLRQISHCDFRNSSTAYEKGWKLVMPHSPDNVGECRRNSVCFYKRSDLIRKKYIDLCENHYNKEINLQDGEAVKTTLEDLKYNWLVENSRGSCRLPLNPIILSGLCTVSKFVAYKILRVCDLERLEEVYTDLLAEGNEVYIIHLVRDPRAIARSLMEMPRVKPERILWRAGILCQRLERNIKYVERTKSEKRGMVPDGRYLRVRHEDIATNPIKSAEKIYNFIGEKLHNDVLEWLQDATDLPGRREYYKERYEESHSWKEKREYSEKLKMMNKQSSDIFGTVRNSKAVVNKWRKVMKFEIVEQIQTKCSYAMEQLDYKTANNEQTMRDLNITLW